MIIMPAALVKSSSSQGKASQPELDSDSTVVWTSTAFSPKQTIFGAIIRNFDHISLELHLRLDQRSEHIQPIT